MIQRTSWMGMVAIMKPASAGPSSHDRPPMDWLRPAMRSTVMPDTRDTSPTSADRAAMPGMSPTAPMMPSATNHAMVNPRRASTMMTPTTDAAEIRSEMMDIGLRPNVSMRCPPRNANNRLGKAMAAATRPAAAGSPVRSRTSHGHTMVATALPSIDVAADAR